MKAALFFILGFLENLTFVPGSDIYVSINWAPQNPVFIADGEKCAKGARNLNVQHQGKVNFICPNLASVLQQSSVAVQTSAMYENLWLLYQKTAFDACDLSLDPMRRRLLTCTSPAKLVFSSVIFAPHTAEPNGLTFEPGRSYYFIATSDGTQQQMNNTLGGHCNDASNKVYMKIKVYVCKKSNQTYRDPNCASGVGVVQCPAPVRSTVGDKSTQPTSMATISTTDNRSNGSLPDNQARTGDNDEELKMWKTCALSAFGVTLLCILLLILCAVFFFRYRSKRHVASEEVALQQETVPSAL